MGRKIRHRSAGIEGPAMKLWVTGATGFLGRHVVDQLLDQGHSVVAIVRDPERAQTMPWFERVKYIQCDLHKDFGELLEADDRPDALVHLAWAGLGDFRNFFHVSTNLAADLAFLEAAIRVGIKHLVVAGTCLEYGMQYGPLSEETDTHPSTAYGLAKDTLRKSLQLLQKEVPFTMQWMRLFYMYGKGQNPNSLLSQLDRAIDEGKPVFNMSAGDQLRDYLPVEQVAKYFALVLDNPQCQGVINCCSGAPVSVFDLVSRHCQARGSNIQLNRGYYPYPDYEPLAFWGISTKLPAIGQSEQNFS